MTLELTQVVESGPTMTARLDEQREIRSRVFHPSGAATGFTEADVEQSITSRFEEQAALYPDRMAIKMPPARQGGPARQWTYRALNERANHLARVLLARGAGSVSRGGEEQEPVALLLEDQAWTVAAMLAILKAGKLYVTLDPEYPPSRLQFMMRDSGAGLVVTDRKNRKLAAELGLVGGEVVEEGTLSVDRVVDVDQLESPGRADVENPDLGVAPDALAYIIYTSGSTGAPKGIVYDHRSVLAGIRNYTNAFQISPHDRLTLLHSMSFSSAMVDVYNALLNGATLYPWNVKTQGLSGLAEWLAGEGVTICDWVPSPFRYFVDTLTGSTDFPDLRLLVLASEPVTKRDIDLYRKHFSRHCILVNRLGTTETYNYRLFFVDHDTELAGNLVPAGYAVPDKVVELRDPAGRTAGEAGGTARSSPGSEVPYGEVGEITVRSRYLARGYWRRPELTRERFRATREGVGDDSAARVYWTGDLGVMHPDGLLEYQGRKDFQIKIRGFRIEPAEIETALTGLPTIRDAAVIAWDGGPGAGAGRGEKQLVAYVVPAGDSIPGAAALRSTLLEKLPDYMVPAAFVPLEALPLTPSGKLDRRALPGPGATGASGGGAGQPAREDGRAPAWDLGTAGARRGYLRPRDELEQGLASTWQRILGVERIGIRDNFFELGGHSMSAVRLLVAIERDLGYKISPPTFYRFPTIEQLAEVLRKNGTDQGSPASPLVALRPAAAANAAGPFDPTAYTMPGWLLTRGEQASREGYSRPPLFVLPGNLGNVHTDLGHLAEFLGPDQPVYGLQDGPEVPARIPKMAELYVDEIRQVQPGGPYLLGGVCLGAVVAFEMAQRLEAEGEKVALLAMVEPARPWRPGIEAYVSFVRFVLTKTVRRLGTGRNGHARGRAGAGPASVPQGKGASQGMAAGVEGARVGLAWLRMKLKLVANVWALRHYVPSPYSGNVHLFMSHGSLEKAQEILGSAREILGSAREGLGSAREILGSAQEGLGSAREILGSARLSKRRNPQLDWLQLIEGETPIHDIPGNHDSITGDNRVIIEQAHMEVLALKLRRSIDQALKMGMERNDR